MGRANTRLRHHLRQGFEGQEGYPGQAVSPLRFRRISCSPQVPVQSIAEPCDLISRQRDFERMPSGLAVLDLPEQARDILLRVVFHNRSGSEFFKKPRNGPREDGEMLDFIACLTFRAGVSGMQLADEERAGVEQNKIIRGAEWSAHRSIRNSGIQSGKPLQNLDRSFETPPSDRNVALPI